jgi:hypothetical protein
LFAGRSIAAIAGLPSVAASAIEKLPSIGRKSPLRNP